MSVSQPEVQEKSALGVSDITFVSESQAQNNCTDQKKKARKPRRRAPIYWGKKPNKKKKDAKRKLDSDLDLAKDGGEVIENGEHDADDVAGNSAGDGSAEEDTEKAEESDKLEEAKISQETGEAVDANCDVEKETRNTDGEDVHQDSKIVENGEESSLNGDVVLLSELSNDSYSKNDTEHISLLPQQTMENHVLCEMEPRLTNGIIEEGCSEEFVEDRECDIECIGEKTTSDNVISVLECCKLEFPKGAWHRFPLYSSTYTVVL